MPVIDIKKDPEALTLTLVAEFDASVERVWQIWEDPRQLERWWGPPTYPATFERHEFVVGGRSHYYMTGPDGDQPHGWWTIEAIEEPNRFEFIDGFADENGEPTDLAKPTRGVVTLEDLGGGRTRMTTVSYFPDTETLQQLSEMGMEDGMREAAGQIDDLLASQPAR
ncbi:SRPBCC domain-containing protein [Lysobacter korlensis]|uniref:SRPBCC domain-containing protein n=1 Tax=Lysobacter korlensis TaxID=553636 RepID=A0ABV6RVC5_9GAMM